MVHLTKNYLLSHQICLNCFLDKAYRLSKKQSLSYPYLLHSFLRRSILGYRKKGEINQAYEKEISLKIGKEQFSIGLTVGVLALGAAYLAKKTGFFEDDSHLYDEYESI